jgi:hypothetical protein
MTAPSTAPIKALLQKRTRSPGNFVVFVVTSHPSVSYPFDTLGLQIRQYLCERSPGEERLARSGFHSPHFDARHLPSGIQCLACPLQGH